MVLNSLALLPAAITKKEDTTQLDNNNHKENGSMPKQESKPESSVVTKDVETQIQAEETRREILPGKGKGLYEHYVETEINFTITVMRDLVKIADSMLNEHKLAKKDQEEVDKLKALPEGKPEESASKVSAILQFLNEKSRRKHALTEADLQEKCALSVMVFKPAGVQIGGIFTQDATVKICNLVFAPDRENPFGEINWTKHSPRLIACFLEPTGNKIKIPEELGLKYGNLNDVVPDIFKALKKSYRPARQRLNELQVFRFKQNRFDQVIKGIHWVKGHGEETINAFDASGKKIGVGSIIRSQADAPVTNWTELDLNSNRNEMIKMAGEAIVKCATDTAKIS
jgi:hypothetical protein